MRPNDTADHTSDDTDDLHPSGGTAVPTCPECGEPVQSVPPTVAAAWTAQDRPVPQWSHLDGQPLCPVVGLRGYQPADPT